MSLCRATHSKSLAKSAAHVTASMERQPQEKKTRYGLVAGKKDWMGYTVEINVINEDGSIGEFVGYFEFADTGLGMDSDGDGIGDTIREGNSIDVWVNSLKDAYAWRDKYGDYVYIKIIKAKG